MNTNDLPQNICLIVQGKQSSAPRIFFSDAGEEFFPVWASFEEFQSWSDSGGETLTKGECIVMAWDRDRFIQGTYGFVARREKSGFAKPIDIHFRPESGQLTALPKRRIRVSGTGVIPYPESPAAKQLNLGEPTLGQSFEVSEHGPSMIWVEPGVFLMGASEAGGDFVCEPAHKVTVTRGFWLGKTPVTQAQWRAVMGTNPSKFKGDSLPVEFVGWEQCVDFCQAVTSLALSAGRLPAGYAYQLPTEAQWEYACRAGSTGNFPGLPDELAWHKGNSGDTSHPVGSKKPNAWGLYDMHGNVAEWCADWMGMYSREDVNDPHILAMYPYDGKPVVRGGSYKHPSSMCSSIAREHAGQRDHCLIGFRLSLGPLRHSLRPTAVTGRSEW